MVTGIVGDPLEKYMHLLLEIFQHLDDKQPYRLDWHLGETAAAGMASP
jgi:hypothetical protein